MGYREFLDRNRLNIGWGILLGMIAAGTAVSIAYGNTNTSTDPTDDTSIFCGVLPKLPPQLSQARLSVKERHEYDLLDTSTARAAAKQFLETGGCHYGSVRIILLGKVACQTDTAALMPAGEFAFNCTFSLSPAQIPSIPFCETTTPVPDTSVDCKPMVLPTT
jgi:hypothetical protein